MSNNKKNSAFMRDIRCPIHNCLLGKYDARDGLINTTFYCQKCRREYIFTIKKEENLIAPRKNY